MRDDQIHKLFNEYACDFEEGMNVSDEILRLIQTNKDIKEDVEASITEEWLKRVKEVGKFYVIFESISRESVPTDVVERRKNKLFSNLFPFVKTTFMDFGRTSMGKNELIEEKVPSMRLCKERIKIHGYNSERNLGRFVDEAR